MTCSKQIFEYTHKADSANRLTLWYWAKNYSWHIAVTVQKYLLDIAWTLFVRVKIISVFIKNMTVSRTELQIYQRVCKVWKVLLAVEKDDISIVLSLLSKHRLKFSYCFQSNWDIDHYDDCHHHSLLAASSPAASSPSELPWESSPRLKLWWFFNS